MQEGTLTRTIPLDPSQHTTDAQVQRWLGAGAARRSLPTNIADPPASIHVNTIRQVVLCWQENVLDSIRMAVIAFSAPLVRSEGRSMNHRLLHCVERR